MKCSLVAAALGLAMSVGAQTTPVKIDVDLSKRVGPYTPIYAWFGYDESNYTTAPNGQKLLRELHDLSPVSVYVRAHHLFTSGDGTADLKWSSSGVYSEDGNGKPVYRFGILDGIFDAYMKTGVRPMVELGFMPKDLAAKLPDKPDQAYQIHFPGNVLGGASNNPPKDYAKWQELCRVVVAHLVERYGKDRVRTWYFEVWNEPDIAYWHGTADEYYKLYDASVAGVRAALPDAKVGGPATTGPGWARGKKPRDADKPYNTLKGFLEHVRSTHQPLDFVSYHVKGRPSIENNEVTMGINHELQDASRGFELIASFPEFKRTPIILSEADPEGCAACSAKTNPANAYRNGTLYPAYTAASFARLFTLADQYGVNLLGAVTWAFEFEGREAFEGFRELATDGIDKPELNYFRMAGIMRGDRVTVTSTGATPLETMRETGVRAAPDVNAMATVDGRTAWVLYWNYADSVSHDATVPLKLSVTGLPEGVRRVTERFWKLDETHGNAYTAWKAMGSPAHPTAEQVEQLQKAAALEPIGPPTTRQDVKGTYNVSDKVAPETLTLVELSW